MSKKGFNWKARKVVTAIIDHSEAKKIKVDFETTGNYDESNQLVLPSKKTKAKIKVEKITRVLTKKQRKRLEKIVEKKKKKENRASVLESLQKVQASQEELSQLTSITTIQTKGLKRYLSEEANPGKVKPVSKRDTDLLSGKIKINAIRGAYRGKEAQRKRLKINDPNVVTSETSGSDTSDSEPEEETKTDVQPATTEEKDNQEKVTEIVEEEVKPIEIKDDIKPSSAGSVMGPPKIAPSKPAVFVEVFRTEEIQAARLKLPILAEEQHIMEVINENPIVIITGETGSGKTTQIPQFLYEAGYALNKQIAVTEPRRVAAISMSQRVAEEMNLSSREVSYLIRFEGNVTEDTKIKFMTDGVLFKELQTDATLSKYSVIILDEAHERSVHTDLLLGLLSRVVPFRHKKGDPLKLIIMSATFHLEELTSNPRLFKIPPPVVNVEARQFPITVHFDRRTETDYLKVAFNKTVKIHTTLPEGGILVFVTGQQEVTTLVRKLRKAFPLRHKKKVLEKNSKLKRAEEEIASDDEKIEEGLQRVLQKKKKKIKVIPDISLDDYGLPGDSEPESDGEPFEDDDMEVTVFTNAQPLWTLPLFSLLPSEKQQKVFQSPPPGCRLCVVSTNVAETSLTIPGIKYVVDTGKAKVQLYDKVTGATLYVVDWISKASANQRSGRAGRVGPGHCYRLYSSAVFNDTFKEFSVPEIQQKPLDQLYLQMKYMKIDKVLNFPFPTAPDLMQLKMAEKRLETLGALKEGRITPLGESVVQFPLLPRYGKMLALSHQHGLLPYTICLVAALSVQELLLEIPISHTTPEDRKQIREKWTSVRRQWINKGNKENFRLLGDNMVLLTAVGAAEVANTSGQLEKFCEDNGVRPKALLEVRKMRQQLTNEVKKITPDLDLVVDPLMKPPTDLQARQLRQILLSGMGDQIARKIQPDELTEGQTRAQFKYAYQANDMEEPVFLDRGSVFKDTLPSFVIYREIYETNKMYMKGVTAIEPEWLPTYAPTLCNLSEPLLNPEPRYNPATGKVHCTVSGTFGPQAWTLPQIEIVYPPSLNAYKWFARFLLEGKVFTRLEKYVPRLLSRPAIIVTNWARLQPRTEIFLKALLSADCCSKSTLEDIWRTNPQYLLPEYLKWTPDSGQGEVSLLWPPLDKN